MDKEKLKRRLTYNPIEWFWKYSDLTDFMTKEEIEHIYAKLYNYENICESPEILQELLINKDKQIAELKKIELEIKTMCAEFHCKDVYELHNKHYWAERCAKEYFEQNYKQEKEIAVLKKAYEKAIKGLTDYEECFALEVASSSIKKQIYQKNYNIFIDQAKKELRDSNEK